MRILSSDILIADVIIPLEGHRELQALVKRYALPPGSKTAISKEQFDAFSAAADGVQATVMPGGSSANVLVTLNKLCGLSLAVDFLGVVGDDEQGRMIRRSLAEAGVRLLPHSPPPGALPRSGVSYVMRLADGNRIIATYPGNAGEILKPDMISEKMVQESDVLFLQGSLWKKMGEAYAGRLLALGKKHQKEIWFALPTYAGLSGEQAALFHRLIADADMVLGNEEELARVFAAPPEEALRRLQKILPGKAGAFITRGGQGAAVVNRERIDYVPLASVSARIVNSVGAGDTAFAGFLAGRLKGLPDAASAEIAMGLAAEKMTLNAARLPDPLADLHRLLPGRFL